MESRQKNTPKTVVFPRVEAVRVNIQKETYKKTQVAVCTASKSRGHWDSIEMTSLTTILIPSVKRTITKEEMLEYNLTLYIAVDDNDPFWLKHHPSLYALVKDEEHLSVKVVVVKNVPNRVPFNDVTARAFKDGAEYIVRVNDDSEFITKGWITQGIEALRAFSPPNVGVVGPLCREGNTVILTHDMVHRTHLQIFETYYPPVFHNWWLDDWITRVYEPDRSRVLKTWVVKHHTDKHGTRYSVKHEAKKELEAEIGKGKMLIRKWIMLNGKGSEYTRASLQTCKQYTPSQYVWDSNIKFQEIGIMSKTSSPIHSTSEWNMDARLIQSLSRNHRISYKEVSSSYRTNHFDTKITTLGKDFSHERVATVKNAVGNSVGLIMDTVNCNVFRNGGCDTEKKSKMKIDESIPTYDKVITIAMKWGSETWHFVGEALVGLAHIQDTQAYKIHVSAKTSFVVAWLGLIGVQEHQIVTGTIFAKTLLIPELGKCGNPSPKQITWLQERIKMNLPAPKEDKYVLIVKRTKSRKQKNWNDILKVAKQFYQHVVVHDDSNLPSVEQQLQNFQNAHTVIAPHGAGLINILACQPHTQVIEFMDQNNMNLCYSRISYILGLNYNAIEMTSSMDHVSEVFEKRKTIVLTKVGNDGMGHMLLGTFSLHLYARLDDQVKLVKRNDHKTPDCRGSTLCEEFYLLTEKQLPTRTQFDHPQKKDHAWTELSSWCEPGKASEERIRKCSDEREKLAMEWRHVLDLFRKKHGLIKKQVGVAVHIRKGDATWGPNVNSPAWIQKTIHKFFSSNKIDLFMQYRGDADEYVSVLDNPIQHVGGDTFHTWLHFIDAEILYVSATSFTLSAAIFRKSPTVSNSDIVHKGRYDWNVKKCKIDDLWFQNGYGNNDDCRLGNENTSSSLQWFKIIVLTMNRHESLKRLLNSLENTDYGKDKVRLHIHIDNSSDNIACIKVAKSFVFSHGDVSLEIADNSNGLRNAWFNAWRPFEHERAIVLEDDIEVSPQWYLWMKKAWESYGNRNDLAGISLQRQTLVPQKPHKMMEIVNNHEPFLYRLVGSIGFSPHWRQWRAFLNWIDSVDTSTVNVRTPGLITSDWLDKLDRRHIWTQYFIWFCNQHELYTLYVNLPKKETLASHMREKGEHFSRTGGRDFNLATKLDMVFPINLVKYEWDGHQSKPKLVTDGTEYGGWTYDASQLTSNSIVYNKGNRGQEVSFRKLNFHSDIITKAREIQLTHGMLVLQILNEGYLEMTKSWICNVKSFPGAINHVLFVATDQISYNTLKEFDPTLTIYLVNVNAVKNMEYGQKIYFKYMLWRAKFLETLLLNDITILLTEADQFWFKNVVDDIKQRVSFEIDFLTLNDFCSSEKKLVNNGFRLIRPSIQLVQIWKNYISKYESMLNEYKNTQDTKDIGDVSEQILLSNMIKSSSLSYKFLPVESYVCGKYFEDPRKYNDPILVHNNWIKGNHNKIARAKKWGHWFLDGKGKCIEWRNKIY